MLEFESSSAAEVAAAGEQYTERLDRVQSEWTVAARTQRSARMWLAEIAAEFREGESLDTKGGPTPTDSVP